VSSTPRKATPAKAAPRTAEPHTADTTGGTGYPEAIEAYTTSPGPDSAIASHGGTVVTESSPVPEDVAHTTTYPAAGPLDAPIERTPPPPVPGIMAYTGGVSRALAHQHTGLVDEDGAPITDLSTVLAEETPVMYRVTKRVLENFVYSASTDQVGTRLVWPEGVLVPKTDADRMVAAAKESQEAVAAAEKPV
jgi:hypothetical protein